MAEIQQDAHFLFPQLRDYLRDRFPGAAFYAFGSRTRTGPCNKCDFDILVGFPYPESYEALVAFLQTVDVYGSMEYRRRLLARMNNRSMYGVDYLRNILTLYVEDIKDDVERYFQFTKDEYQNPVRVDLMVAFDIQPDDQRFALI